MSISMLAAKCRLGGAGAKIGVLAKIESADSVNHLEEILDAVDGAMVARGDLGAELPVEQVRAAAACAPSAHALQASTWYPSFCMRHPSSQTALPILATLGCYCDVQAPSRPGCLLLSAMRQHFGGGNLLAAEWSLTLAAGRVQVPFWQSRIVQGCRKRGKPVIVATNMLESMIENPTPTRAEVSDIAIAVREGADAIMLSGETAYGRFPFKSVAVMATVAKRTEASMLSYQVHVRTQSGKAACDWWGHLGPGPCQGLRLPAAAHLFSLCTCGAVLSQIGMPLHPTWRPWAASHTPSTSMGRGAPVSMGHHETF